jgi:hypothetical protein
MKRINKGRVVRYESLRLFSDDVDEIYTILRETFDPDKIAIIAGDYELDAPTDLQQMGPDPLSGMTIRTPADEFNIEIGPSRIVATALKSDTISEGQMQRIVKVLDRCGTPMNTPVVRMLAGWSLVAAFTVIVYATSWFRQLGTTTGAVVSTFIGAVGVGIPILYVRFNRVHIHTTPRLEHRSFLTRKGDDLWILLIGAVIGAVLATAGSWLTSDAKKDEAPCRTAPTHAAPRDSVQGHLR